jgi:hypothetical protein
MDFGMLQLYGHPARHAGSEAILMRPCYIGGTFCSDSPALALRKPAATMRPLACLLGFALLAGAGVARA